MRKEYGKALRALFTNEMSVRLPQFAATQVKSLYLFPGERPFCWNVDPAVTCWVVLVPHHKGRESFTLEIGWSKLARFPELSVRPSVESPCEDHAEFAEPEYVCRLGKDSVGEDYWSEIEPFRVGLTEAQWLTILQEQMKPIPKEEALLRVRPHVLDAVVRLERFGVPYLNTFVAYCTGLR